MRRIIAGTLALTVLSSTWLLAAEGATKAMPKPKKAPAKAAKMVKKAPPPVSAQMQQMKDQLNQQQQQINQLQQQLQQSNQQLQATQQSMQANVQKASMDAAAAQQAAASAQQSANSLNSSVADLKTTTATMSQTLAATQKDVKELLSPLAIRYKGITITPNGFMDLGAVYAVHNMNSDINANFAAAPLSGTVNTAMHQFRMSSRISQVGFLAQGNAGNAKLSGFWQIDFEQQGTSTNFNSSNSFVPRIRQAWGRVELPSGWVISAGQMYTLNSLNRKLAYNLTEWTATNEDQATDVGADTTNRVPSIRFMKVFANGKQAIAFSVDQPDYSSTTAPAAVQGPKTTAAAASGTNYIAQQDPVTIAPDLWLKYAVDTKHGHFAVRGVTRFFQDYLTPATAVCTLASGVSPAQTAGACTGNATGGKTNTSIGYGFGFEAGVPVTKKVDYMFTGLAGRGIGRYLNATNSNDVTFNPTYALVPIKAVGVTTGFEFHPAPKYDVNVYVGTEYYARTAYGTSGYGVAAAGTVPTDNKNIDWVLGNIIYRWYRGAYGTFQTGVYWEYFKRQTWAGTLAAGNCTTGGISYVFDNCTAKGWNSVGWLSIRYVLP